jgi:PKD repeat protein
MKKIPRYLFFSLLLIVACKDLEKPLPLLPSNDTKADFSFTPTGCKASCPVSFTNASTGSGTLTYSWNFADPTSGSTNTSTAKDPTHEFKVAGSYDVTLTTTGKTGTNEAKKTVIVEMAQPTTFEKIYAGSGGGLADIAELSNGSFIAVGSSYNSLNNTGKALVYKLDSKGKETTYSIGDFDAVTAAHGIALTADGGFFMGASVLPKGANFIVNIYRISSNDAITKTIKFTAAYINISALHKTNDGGCVFTGVKRKVTGDKNQIWVVRLDANGNTVFDVTFDGWTGKDVIQIPDGNFIVCGETESVSNKIIKLDAIGTKIWEDGPYNHYTNIIPFGLTLTKDGNYLMGGDAQGNNLYYAYIASVNPDKSIKWYYPYGGADYSFGRSIATHANGNIVLVGYAGNNTDNNALLYITDSDGKNAMKKVFGGAKNQNFSKVIATKDGGFIMVGTTYKNDDYGEPYIVKTDKNGNIQ